MEVLVSVSSDKPIMTKKLLYTRGGTGRTNQEITLMKKRAINISASMKLKVKSDVSVKYDGECLIEACLSQLKRSDLDFREILGSQYWREKVVDRLQNNHMAYNLFTPRNVNKTQTKMKQWRNDWKILRENGQFNCEAGDLMAPGLALVLSKNILVINTDSKSNK